MRIGSTEEEAFLWKKMAWYLGHIVERRLRDLLEYLGICHFVCLLNEMRDGFVFVSRCTFVCFRKPKKGVEADVCF